MPKRMHGNGPQDDSRDGSSDTPRFTDRESRKERARRRRETERLRRRNRDDEDFGDEDFDDEE